MEEVASHLGGWSPLGRKGCWEHVLSPRPVVPLVWSLVLASCHSSVGCFLIHRPANTRPLWAHTCAPRLHSCLKARQIMVDATTLHLAHLSGMSLTCTFLCFLSPPPPGHMGT